MLDRNGCTHFEAVFTIARMLARIASAVGRTEGGLAVWGLLVLGADVAGRWVIVDRRVCHGRVIRLVTAQDCARADMSFCRIRSSQPRSRVSGKPFAVLAVPVATEQKTTIFQGGRSGERSLRRTGVPCKASFREDPLRRVVRSRPLARVSRASPYLRVGSYSSPRKHPNSLAW